MYFIRLLLVLVFAGFCAPKTLHAMPFEHAYRTLASLCSPEFGAEYDARQKIFSRIPHVPDHIVQENAEAYLGAFHWIHHSLGKGEGKKEPLGIKLRVLEQSAHVLFKKNWGTHQALISYLLHTENYGKGQRCVDFCVNLKNRLSGLLVRPVFVDLDADPCVAVRPPRVVIKDWVKPKPSSRRPRGHVVPRRRSSASSGG